MDFRRGRAVVIIAGLVMVLLLIAGYGFDLASIGFSDSMHSTPATTPTTQPQVTPPVEAIQVPPATGTTDGVKVAFTADTGFGQGFKNVLTLIKEEKADLVLLQGDFAYQDGKANEYFDIMHGQAGILIDESGTPIPVLGSDGNHDDWSEYMPHFNNQLQAMGVTPTDSLDDAYYGVKWNGLKMAFLGEDENPKDASYIHGLFGNETSTWGICSWHKNQEAMQVGGKENEAGWPRYEACREAGALIFTGHEHSYHRTIVLTDMDQFTVDTQQHAMDENGAATNIDDLVIGPGKTVVFVSGLGGKSMREQKRCLPDANSTEQEGCHIWGNIFTTAQTGREEKFGALFITFRSDGTADGYFKTTDIKFIDEFTINKAQ
jgi:hypothetical protein